MIISIPNLLRRSLLCLAGATMIQTAQAQFRYTFKDTTTAYTALSSATSLNGSTLWDDDDFIAPIPFTWKMDSVITMTDVPVSTTYLGILDNLANITSANGLTPGLGDFIDRGTSSSLSPISYVTTGTSPKRIFKLEFNNAGFYDDNSNTDYVNFQIWIYETTNVVEFHYGPSSISPGTDYFYTGAGPLVGGFKNADFDNATAGTIYYLDGSMSPKTIDSVSIPSLMSGFPSNGLAAWPADGTVFRFTPGRTSCALPVASFTASNQSALSARFTFTGTTSGLDSLVWNFGDMQKQKVTSGFATPITHTYTTAGRYNATVTAYNSCGSARSTASQVKVAVADVPGLADVRVYPTMVEDAFYVDGLSAGSRITVYSQSGQKVREAVAEQSRMAVRLGGLPAGVYSVHMTNKGNQGTARVVKQ